MPRTRLLSAIAAAALVLVPALPAAASADAPSRTGWHALPGDTSDFSFRSFDAEYTLTRTPDQHAALDVVETAVAVFPSFDQNRGIIRALPEYYGDVFLDPQVVGVTDENGDDVFYEVQSDGGYTLLLLGDDTFVHGATTYVIHYTMSDTIRAFADTGADEFYWDVNGTGWGQPFGEVGARVMVGPELAAALTGANACYQGESGSTQTCTSGVTVEESAGSTVVSARADDLGPGETLTVAVAFAAGTFVEGEPVDPGTVDPGTDPGTLPPDLVDLGDAPPLWALLVGVLGGPASLVIGIVAAVLLRRPRAQPTGFIIPQYSVPGLDIMVAAELVERGSTAVQAQLVSLAVKRKIRLLGYPVHDADAADYAVQLLDATGLESWEQAVVTALFGPDAEPGTVRDLLRSGDSELAETLRPIVAALPDAVTQSGFIGPKKATKGALWWVLAAAVAAVAGFLGAVFSGITGFFLGVVGFPFVVIGVLLAAFAARRRPTLSPAGAQMVDYLLGMKMYLELAEKDRFAVLQSATGAERIDTSDGRQIVKLYEKLLPWAVVWGVEDSWARELEIQLQQTGADLDWYTGAEAFHWAAFSTLMSGLNTGTSSPVASSSGISSSGSSWSGSSFGSSFSGGSSGGGFSGGGGGGGGGGGR